MRPHRIRTAFCTPPSCASLYVLALVTGCGSPGGGGEEQADTEASGTTVHASSDTSESDGPNPTEASGPSSSGSEGESTGAVVDPPPSAAHDLFVQYTLPRSDEVVVEAPGVLSNDSGSTGLTATVFDEDEDDGLLPCACSLAQDGSFVAQIGGSFSSWSTFQYFVTDEAGQSSAHAQVSYQSIAGVDLTRAPASDIISCPEGAEGCGMSIANAGDFNGDGQDDLVVGWPDSSESGGNIHVVYGGTATGGELVEFIDAGDGFSVENRSDSRDFGHDVAGVGDVNGDGFDDIAVVSWGTAVHVIHGRAEAGQSTLAQEEKAGRVFSLTSQGESVVDVDSLHGDMNDDGFDDFLVGSFDPSGDADSRTTYIIWGREAPGIVALEDVIVEHGWRVRDDLGERFSLGIRRGVGDINNDGIPDFAMSDGRTAQVVFGSASPVSFSLSNFADDGSFGVTVANGGRIEAIEPVLDYGGPGQHAVAFGDTQHSAAKGHVVVVTSFDSNVDLEDETLPEFMDLDASRLGSDVAAAGDVNGDGRGDLMIRDNKIVLLDGFEDVIDGRRTYVAHAADDPDSLRHAARGEGGYVVDHAVLDGEPRDFQDQMVAMDFDGDGALEHLFADERIGVITIVHLDAP